MKVCSLKVFNKWLLSLKLVFNIFIKNKLFYTWLIFLQYYSWEDVLTLQKCMRCKVYVIQKAKYFNSCLVEEKVSWIRSHLKDVLPVIMGKCSCLMVMLLVSRSCLSHRGSRGLATVIIPSNPRKWVNLGCPRHLRHWLTSTRVILVSYTVHGFTTAILIWHFLVSFQWPSLFSFFSPFSTVR